MFDPEANLDLDQLRTRLANMTDVELRSFGQSAAYMCSPEANLGTEPRPVFVLQLNEARAEWQRRHRNNEQSSNCQTVPPRPWRRF
jgi:hypothetical protein